VRCNSMKRGESNKRSDVKASSTNSSHHRLRTTKTMHTDGQRKQRRTRLRGRGTLVCASSSVSSSRGDNFAIPLSTIVSILAVMLAAFFHLLGFTATGPITPELVKHFDIPGSKSDISRPPILWVCFLRCFYGLVYPTYRWWVGKK
jgi:hypothetical protein